MPNIIGSYNKIVFTGTESTGKSYCSRIISSDLGLHLIEEQARIYLEKKRSEWNTRDILKIAELQKKIEIEAKKQHSAFICDTDLLTIKIWLEFINEKVPNWITAHLQNNPATHYLLMCPEKMEWVEDGIRKNEKERDYIHQLYIKSLNDLKIPYTIIRSDKENRLNEIKDALKLIMIEIV